jgi:hypothetical protein
MLSLTCYVLGVGRRKPAVLLLILALIASTTAPFLSVKANPMEFPPREMIPVPEGVNITVNVASPTENAVYHNRTINVNFDATIDGPSSLSMGLHIISTYQGDWMQESAWCPFPPGFDFGEGDMRPSMQRNFTIFDIPFGEHMLNITVSGSGGYWENGTEYLFNTQKTVSVRFAIPTNPIITFALLQDATFETSSVPLNFTVDYPVTEMSYCLDGQEPLPLSGNATLTDLANGQHNVTVYATSKYGYTGVSETLFFNVNAPEFPVAPFITVSAAVVASAFSGVIVFFKKRKR